MQHSATNPVPSSHGRFTVTKDHAVDLCFELAAEYGHLYEIVEMNTGYYVVPVAGSPGV